MYAKFNGDKLEIFKQVRGKAISVNDILEKGYKEVVLNEKPNDNYPRYSYRFEDHGDKIIQVWYRYPDKKKLIALEKKLATKDYLFNKLKLGEVTEDDQKWIDYIAWRKEILDEYHIIESCPDE